MRGVKALPVLVLGLAACGGERVETDLELRLLNLSPSATRLQFVFSTEVTRAVSQVARTLISGEDAVVVFEGVLVHPTFSVYVAAYSDDVLVQQGQVVGETRGDRSARWSVTLAPIDQAGRLCDGLDNNENGEIDEVDCSG